MSWFGKGCKLRQNDETLAKPSRPLLRDYDLVGKFNSPALDMSPDAEKMVLGHSGNRHMWIRNNRKKLIALNSLQHEI